MSWIRDWENRLVNLEDVRRIEVDGTSNPDEIGFTHGVFAYAVADANDDEPSYCFAVGSEEEMHKFIQQLEEKLPMVKVRR